MWLINILLLEVFVIIIEYLVIHVEMLSGIQRATLVSLIALGKLFLWRDVKVAGSDCKLFHVSLWVNISNTLVHVVN